MQMTAPRRDMVDSSSASAYVYAVTWADEASAHADGVAGAPVVSVAHRRVAALVSLVDPSLVRARRRDLLRHSDVVLAASRVGTVVPVGFGTVFASADDVV